MTSSLPAEATTCVTEWLGEGWTASALAGDASARAYYRITGADTKTYMLAYYPPEVRAQLRRFLDAYNAVSPHGRIPEVLKHCGFAVMQDDVGDQTLYDLLHSDRVAGLRLYRDAIDLLVAFQRAPGGQINPPFTAGFFLDELDMTREFYAEKLMGVPEAYSGRLEPFFRKLADKLAGHPYRLCHRDFHGQNIHIVTNALYLIDYQDLRMGPDTYDLASLLRDRGAGVVIGDAEHDLVGYYAAESGAPPGVRERYFESLLQRSIKILGTFSKQAIVRDRLHYLEFIRPTLDAVRKCLEELPEFAAIADVLPMHFSVAAARTRVESLKET